MNCKSCNTRVPPGASHCPNCGLVCSSGATRPADPELTGPAPLSPSVAHEAIDLEEIATPSPRREKKSSNKRGAAPAANDSSPNFGFAPRAAELRALLAEKPQLLEAGLSIFKQQGKAVGENFETDLGPINLLAADDAGALVVILIARDDAKEIVTDMLGRIGWVRKHAAKPGQEVRGIVLADKLPEAAKYTAAAVADTVSFKSYQVALTFSDIVL